MLGISPKPPRFRIYLLKSWVPLSTAHGAGALLRDVPDCGRAVTCGFLRCDVITAPANHSAGVAMPGSNPWARCRLPEHWKGTAVGASIGGEYYIMSQYAMHTSSLCLCLAGGVFQKINKKKWVYFFFKGIPPDMFFKGIIHALTPLEQDMT